MKRGFRNRVDFQRLKRERRKWRNLGKWMSASYKRGTVMPEKKKTNYNFVYSASATPSPASSLVSGLSNKQCQQRATMRNGVAYQNPACPRSTK